MECYEGATMIKTFRGILADGAQVTINLHTNDGRTGYRIVKLQTFPTTPGTSADESVIQVWSKAQAEPIATGSGTVNFSNDTLLGAVYFRQHSTTTAPATMNVIFDNQIVNQDIYITHTNNEGSASYNYYLELEQISLDLNESTVATLQSIRSS